MPGEFDPLCNPKPQSQKKTIKTATQLRKEGWDEAKMWKEGKFKLSVTSLTRASLPPSPPQLLKCLHSPENVTGRRGDAEIEPFKGDKIY